MPQRPHWHSVSAARAKRSLPFNGSEATQAPTREELADPVPRGHASSGSPRKSTIRKRQRPRAGVLRHGPPSSTGADPRRICAVGCGFLTICFRHAPLFASMTQGSWDSDASCLQFVRYQSPPPSNPSFDHPILNSSNECPLHPVHFPCLTKRSPSPPTPLRPWCIGFGTRKSCSIPTSPRSTESRRAC